MGASFEDYYNEAMRKLKASGQFTPPRQAAPRQAPLNFSGSTIKGGRGDEPQDFLSWLTDIASRPLFAVTETVDSALDVSSKKRAKKRDKEGLPAFLGDVGEVVSAPVRGFFSTNKDDKRYTNELIEKTADTIGGYAGDPDKPGKKYRDVENNVDPTIKGILGFAGDVALDPLTWVPGAQMFKAGQMLTKGGRDAAAAIKAAKKGEKVIGDVADVADVAKAEAPMSRAEADTALEQADLLGSVDIPERAPVPIPEAKVPVAKTPTFANIDHLTPDEQLNVTQARTGYKPFNELSKTEMKAHTPDGPYEVARTVRGKEIIERFASEDHALLYAATLPKSAKYQIRKPRFDKSGQPVSIEQQLADELPPAETPVAPAVEDVPVTPVYRPKPPSEQLAEHAKVPMIREFLEGLSRSVPESKAKALSYDQFVERFIANAPDSSTVPNYMAGVTPGAPKRVPTSSLRTDKEALDSQAVQRYLKAAYQQWQKSHESVVDKLMKPNTKAVITEGSRQDNFTKLLQTAAGVARAEELLGIGLVNRLKRKESSETFDRLVKEISNVLDRGDRLDKIVDEAGLSSVTKALMGQLKIDVVGTNLDILRADSKVAEMADLREASRAAKEAMVEPEAGIRPVVDDVLEKMSTNRQDRLALMNDDEREAVSWLPRVIHDQFFSDKYKHHTLSGIGRTSPVFGKGEGRAERVFGQWTQWNILQAITNHASEKVAQLIKNQQLKLPGSTHGQATTRALYIKAEVERKLGNIEKMFDNEGFQMWMGTTKDDAIPLTMTQMMHALEDIPGQPGANAENMLKFWWNVETAASTTNVSDAVVTLLKGGDKAQIRAELAKTVSRNVNPAHLNANGTIKAKYRDEYHLRNMMVEGRGYFGFYGRMKTIPNQEQTILASLPEGVTLTPKIVRGELKGWYRTYSPDYLLDQLTDIIMNSKPILEDVVAANAAAIKGRIEMESVEMIAASLNRLRELTSSETNIVKAMRAVTDIEKDHENLARSAGAYFDSEVIAKTQIDQSVNPEVRATTESFVAGAEAGQRAGKVSPKAKGATLDKATSDARKRPLQKGHDEVYDANERHTMELLQSAAKTAPGTEARAVVEQRLQEAKDELVDISAYTFAGINSGIGRILHPLRKLFDADYGMTNAYQFMHSMGNGSVARRAEMLKYLNQFAKKHSGNVDGTQTKILTQALRDIQSGAKTSDQAVAQARVDMEQLIAPLFSPTNPDSIFGDVFFRTSASVHRLNEALQGVEIPHQFDVGLAIRNADKNDTDFLTEVVNQWKLWQDASDDPLDFINRIYVAAEQIATDAAVVGNLQAWALRSGFASKSPLPGFVKMTASGDSRYFDMLDQTLYWDKELAGEFAIMDQVSRMSKTFKGDFGKFVHSYFDVTQGAWKYAITIVRPGHHIRNMLGDMSMTFVAEGTKYFRRSSVDAFKILGIKGKYDGLNINRALTHMGEQLPDANEILSSGVFGTLSGRQIADGMFSNGLINSYHAMEDLADVSSPMLNEFHKGKYARTVGTIFLRGKRIEKAAASISEARDHYVRAQHFMQYIHKAQKTGRDHLGRPIKNMEELIRLAARQVKKHHPDGSMLTPFEAKVMRRIIPFYSWVRGALPAIIEGALLHPGRTMVFPKASYNLAISMGIDPDSLYDPFPDDQLFPSFLTEQVFGPQFQLPTGEYLGINPGVASVDVANMFGSDPVHGVMGQISPLLRMGPELVTGGTMGTGHPIRDTSDYIDQNIPGINYLANVSGYSPSGSLSSVLGGKGFDPQSQIEAGNKGPLDQQLSILNWFLGMNVSNQSRPNFINYAEIEKRNREAGK